MGHRWCVSSIVKPLCFCYFYSKITRVGWFYNGCNVTFFPVLIYIRGRWLTSVHSNVYGLSNMFYVRYLIVVDSFLSTSHPTIL